MNPFPALAAAAVIAVSGCATTSVDTITTGSVQPMSGADLKGAFSEQTAKVSTDCFPAELKRVLADLKVHFGKAPVVTSGHRPRSGKSQHSRCKAADIRIPGVHPRKVAAYARTIRGVGGVGTYCRKTIVHVDVGPRRDWKC